MDGLHSLNLTRIFAPLSRYLVAFILAEDERQMDHPQDFHLFFQCGAVVHRKAHCDDHDEGELRGCALR